MTPFGLVYTSTLTLRSSLLPPPSWYHPFSSWAKLKTEAEGRSDTWAPIYQPKRQYHHINGSSHVYKGNGKVFQLQARCGPEGG